MNFKSYSWPADMIKAQTLKGDLHPVSLQYYEVANDNFIRASFQTAYRFPSTQNQYINLQTGNAS